VCCGSVIIKNIISGSAPSRSAYRMHLLAAVSGLRQLKLPCVVTIHTPEDYLLECGKQIVCWNHFTRLKIAVRAGKAKNADLWEEFQRLNETHHIVLSLSKDGVPQEYRPSAKREARREAEEMLERARIGGQEPVNPCGSVTT